MLNDLPGDPLVVENAPQLDLIKRAAVVITHCGANTVLETLLEGKPMVAIPMVFDQPAMAARLHRLKVAEVLSLNRCSAKELRSALTKVLNNSSYCDAALGLRNQIRSVDGVECATNLIEKALGEYYASHPVMERRNRHGSRSQITQRNNARVTGK
jgi:UDP:flavonoid glycosyltransferase YjiC (YdhE family)